MKNGKIIIFSAPSGSGKTTIIKHLIKIFTELGFSISCTTRSPRISEKDQVDYYFISKKTFIKKINQGEFAEWEEVYPGILYGTLNSEIERIWSLGKCVIFDIDVKGGMNLRNRFYKNSLSIFVKVPSFEILKNRLKMRKTENSIDLSKRLIKAENEIIYANYFDFIIINNDLQKSKKESENLVRNFLFQNP